MGKSTCCQLLLSVSSALVFEDLVTSSQAICRVDEDGVLLGGWYLGILPIPIYKQTNDLSPKMRTCNYSKYKQIKEDDNVIRGQTV